MALFIVRHQHDAQTCPAGDPQMGPMLAQHVSKPNGQKFGLEIHGEGVVTGGHTTIRCVDEVLGRVVAAQGSSCGWAAVERGPRR